MALEIEVRQHVLFSGLNRELTNKAKHAAWEFDTAAVDDVGYKTMADIKKKNGAT